MTLYLKKTITAVHQLKRNYTKMLNEAQKSMTRAKQNIIGTPDGKRNYSNCNKLQLNISLVSIVVLF